MDKMNKKGLVWQPMLFSLIIILALVFVIDLVTSEFTDLEELQTNELIGNATNFVDTGFNQTIIDIPAWIEWIPFVPDAINFELNPFALFGNGVKNFLVDQLEVFAVLPVWLIYTLGIVFIMGLVLLFMSFVRGTG